MIRLMLAAVAAIIATSAPAQERLNSAGCAPVAVALRLAMDQYGEAPAYVAESGAYVLTITINPKTGSYTVWGQKESSTMCAVGGGVNWQAAPEAMKKVAPPGRPS